MNKHLLIQGTFGLLCIMIVASMWYFKPDVTKQPDTRIQCSSPRFKVGDQVETVMKEEGIVSNGQILFVHQNVDERNQQCVYTVIYYSKGTRIDWLHWEFELKPFGAAP